MSAVKQIDIRARRRAIGPAQPALPPPRATRAAPRKPQAQPRVSVRAKRRIAWLVLMAAIAVGGWQMWRSGAPQRLWANLSGALDFMPRLPGFTIQDVTVRGRQIVSAEAVMAAINVQRGQPILSFDAEAARKRLESIEWVEQAVVERRLPDTIYVRIWERAAVALWQRDQDFVLIDSQGRAVRTVDPKFYGYLPLIVGPGAPDKINDLFLLLVEEPAIGKRVRAANWVGGRRWTLTLDTMIEILLPEEDAAAALKRLADLDRRERLLARDIQSIDLRLPDRLIVRPIKRNDGIEPGKPQAGPADKPTAGKPGDNKPIRPAPGRPT